jgi:hypothetical protein
VIVYGCCVGSWNKFKRYVARDDRVILAVSGQTSITKAYNGILNYFARSEVVADVEALVLLHDDLEVIDPDAEEKIRRAVAPRDVALVGVAGGSGTASLAWWNGTTYGWQRIDSGDLDLGPRYGDVELLEGSFLVFSPWALRRIRFDNAFTGFHGYDEVAATARNLGARVTVADIDTHHHTQLGFKSAESAESWATAEQLYRRKWFDQ